jgi:hypothetical protein
MRHKRLAYLLFFIGVFPGFLLAQQPSGAVWGSIQDATGQPVPGATVRLVDRALGNERQAITDALGHYRIVSVPPAQYSLRADAPGLASADDVPVKVHVGVAARVDLRLPPIALREQIVVAERVETVASDSAALGMVLTREDLSRLPLNRRDFLQLALLSAGVAPPVEDSELSTRGAFAIHASGAREDANNFQIDGGDNNDPYVGRYVVQPPLDSVQEFQVSTASYSAEHSRNAGAQIGILSRRGEDRWHGFAYEYLRNRAFDARNFFDGREQPQYIRHQFGGGIGGALRRNRSYLFASGDSLVERQGWSRQVTVPALALRAGDFSGRASTVLDPFTRQPFANNQIPQTRIADAGRRVVGLFPEPNRTGASGNLLTQPIARASQPQASLRLDEHLSERDRLTVRYSVGFASIEEPFTEDPDVIPGYGDTVTDRAHQGALSHERVISPITTHALRFSYALLDRDLQPERNGGASPAALGLGWVKDSGFGAGYPRFQIAGYSALGDSTALPIRRTSRSLQVAETLTLARRAHLWKIGGELRGSGLESRVGLLTRGSLSFPGALSGDGLADLLLGFPSFGLRAIADNPIHLQSHAWQGFAQDDWRVHPRFTLNLGLRYEYASPPEDPENRMTLFDPERGELVAAGSAGYSRSGLRADRNNWAPRIGFAWRGPGGWVVRSGYGLYFDAGTLLANTSNYFNPPQFTLRVYFPSATSLMRLEDPFPVAGGMTPPPSVNTVSPEAVTSSLQHWSFTLQRAFGVDGFVSLGYVASKGTHLLRARDLNQPAPGPGTLQLRRSLPQFGNVLFAETGANSSYHSLQATLQRRFRAAGSVWMAYTWSRSIDSASAFLATRGDRNFPQNSARADLERGLSSFDLPHRLVSAWTLPLPDAKGILRRMEIRGIAIVESGRPFTPTLRFDNSNTGNTGGNFGSDRPNLVGDPTLAAPSASRWFDTSMLPVAPRYEFGSAGRNILRGDGFFSLDLSLSRELVRKERMRWQIEAQAFNVLNRTHFQLPGAWADEPSTFGGVFSARPARQLQFSLRWSF